MNEPQVVAGPMFVMIMVFAWLTFVIISVGLTVLIWCRLCSRAGFHWALGFLTIVPIANIVLPFYIAFAEWPILRELKALKKQTPPIVVPPTV